MLGVYRLGQVKVDAGLCRMSPVCLLPVSRHSDDNWFFVHVQFLQPVCNLIPIHPWKANIEKQHIGLISLGLLQSSGAASGNLNLMTIEAEQQSHAIGTVGHVFSDQDA